jgi:glycerophosphoryl diester phosphodiesterase
MTEDLTARSLLAGTIRDFRQTWKTLVLTDVVFKTIAVVVLMPLTGVLFRVLIALSGSAVLSDVDILRFFVGPLGWVCGVLVGAVVLGISAVEQAALCGVLCAVTGGKHLRISGALRFAAVNAWPVIQVTTRIVVRTLLATAPFAVVAVLVYAALLTEFDINYYLRERPPVFLTALAIGGVLLAALIVVLFRLLSSWFFALPLVLFENVKPAVALRTSTERAHGQRCLVLTWVLGWALTSVGLSLLTTAIVGIAGRFLVAGSTESLRWLVVAIGSTLLLGFAANLIASLLSTTTFAAILFGLYRRLGHDRKSVFQLHFAEEPPEGTGPRITRRRLLVGVAAAAIVAVAIGVAVLHGVRREDHVQVMAHRGSSRAAPENTIAAIRRAIDDGADWVEIDVQETADGQVVVFHDSDFMKLAGRKLKIWEATMHDLQDIDIGGWFAPEFQQERVPTLSDVLAVCKNRTRVNIELKYYGHDQQLEQRVADIVESHGMAADVVCMSLKSGGVRKMKALRPEWRVGLLMSVAAGDLAKIEADFLAVNARFATGGLVKSAHKAGKEVYVWTVNDAATMSTMISRGVNGLLTDKPALARSVLEQRAAMSVPERLLLELAGVLGVASEVGDQ